MDISEIPKPALFNLLLQVEPEEIRIVCRAKNPKIREICYLPRFIEEYKNKYKIEEGYLRGFLRPVILDLNLANFLLNADFKNFNFEIHKIIDPLLKKGIFTRAGLTLLFIIYLNNLLVREGNKRFYTVDEKMNNYLNSYLTELENNTVNFNRYKIPFNRIQSIISKGIIPKTKYSVFDVIALENKKVQDSVSNATENIQEISKKLRG